MIYMELKCLQCHRRGVKTPKCVVKIRRCCDWTNIMYGFKSNQKKTFI